MGKLPLNNKRIYHQVHQYVERVHDSNVEEHIDVDPVLGQIVCEGVQNPGYHVTQSQEGRQYAEHSRIFS